MTEIASYVLPSLLLVSGRDTMLEFSCLSELTGIRACGVQIPLQGDINFFMDGDGVIVWSASPSICPPGHYSPVNNVPRTLFSGE